MKFGAIIVTYNRIELLKECIDCCYQQSLSFENIVVINNASTDGTKEYLKELELEKDNIKCITLNENIGGAGGFYTGIKEILEYDIDYVLLIDDDAMICENYIDTINNYIQICKLPAYSGTVMCDDKIQYDHRKYLYKNYKLLESKDNDYMKKFFDYDISTFCGVVIDVKIIKKIGLPEKDFFIWFDDFEYSLRLNVYGKIRNINSIYLNHKTKLNQVQSYNWKSYYGLRNELYIIKKYFSRNIYFKKLIEMKKIIVLGKIAAKLKNDNYYYQIANMYNDAIYDAKNNNLGKNDKYLPGLKFEKRQVL